jgi:hypothetical protein
MWLKALFLADHSSANSSNSVDIDYVGVGKNDYSSFIDNLDFPSNL